MTESEPRKSLWELMGQKQPPATPPAAVDASADPVPPAPTSSKVTPASLPEVTSTPAEVPAEVPTAVQPKSKGLWATMQPSGTGQRPPGPSTTDVPNTTVGVPEAKAPHPGKRIDKRLQQMERLAADAEAKLAEEIAPQSPPPAAKRVDRRLRQVEELEVEIVDEPEPTDLLPPKSSGSKPNDKRLRQVEELEVEIVDEPADDVIEELEPEVESEDQPARSTENAAHDPFATAPRSSSRVRGIPQPAALMQPAPVAVEAHKPRAAGWLSRFTLDAATRPPADYLSIVLGGVSLPLALIGIYPAIWSRLPASLCGFGALVLGTLAIAELQRDKLQPRKPYFAYAGIAMGLLAMFSGPLIFSPLDLYGQWSTSYTGNHLKQIGMGLEAYHQQHGSYPSGAISLQVKGGQAPQPLHGWMTLLLPYLPDGHNLAKNIDLKKAYSDPANQSVMAQTVPSFLAAGGNTGLIQGRYGPAHFSGLGGLLSLPDERAAHVGIFDSNSNTRPDDVTDGLSNTMIAGEISKKYPAWGEPRNWRQIGRGLNREPEGFGNAAHTGAMFLMADGSVRFLQNNTDPKILQSLSTRDGDEPTANHTGR